MTDQPPPLLADPHTYFWCGAVSGSAATVALWWLLWWFSG